MTLNFLLLYALTAFHLIKWAGEAYLVFMGIGIMLYTIGGSFIAAGIGLAASSK